MKIKILIFLLPFFCYSQVNSEVLNKIKMIDSQVKKIDSIASYSVEEEYSGEYIMCHGPIAKTKKNKKPKRYYTNTSKLKVSNQNLRICNRQRVFDGDEDLYVYFADSKLIYAELIIWKEGRKEKTY